MSHANRTRCACQPGAEVSVYCTQCTHLYIKKDGVAPDVRVRKLKEVERHTAVVGWVSRLLNLVVPGLGNVFAGHLGVGLILLALWSLFLAAFVVGGRILEYPESSLALRSGMLFGLNVAALAVVWIWANVLTLLRRS